LVKEGLGVSHRKRLFSSGMESSDCALINVFVTPESEELKSVPLDERGTPLSGSLRAWARRERKAPRRA